MSLAPHLSPLAVSPIFGRFTLESLPLHEPIVVGTFVMVAMGGAALLAALTYFRLWGYLWTQWFTTVDHKKIGILYMVTTFVFFLLGGVEALLLRTQLAQPHSSLLTPQAYNQVFTMHGTTMIFLAVMRSGSAFFN